MRTMWRILSTVVTLAAVVGILAVTVVSEGGWSNFKWLTGAEAESEAPEEQPAAEEEVSAPPPETGLGKDEAKTWFDRLSQLQTDIGEREKRLVADTEKLQKGTKSVAKVTRSLSELLCAVLSPEEFAGLLPGLEKTAAAPKRLAEVEALLQDPEKAAAVTAILKDRNDRGRRVAEVLRTIASMSTEDAAALLGESVPPAAAAEILMKLPLDDRASILGELVRENPRTARGILEQLVQ